MEGPQCRQVERRARRLNDMVAALDVDELALVRKDQGDAYLAARQKCLTCVCPGECTAWLRSDDSKTEAPWYCPNKDLFAELKR